jgi:N-carbamoylputrescine amidase
MRVAAFQNGYFTALCNRVGKEDRLDFAGESFVCAPDGQVMARAGLGTDEILYAEIDFSRLKDSNARQLFMKHRRPQLYSDWLAK